MVNKPLIKPYFWEGVHFRVGVRLTSHNIFTNMDGGIYMGNVCRHLYEIGPYKLPSEPGIAKTDVW